jgi:hypothetical protein
LSKAKKTMNASDRAKADRRINQLGRVLNKWHKHEWNLKK